MTIDDLIADVIRREGNFVNRGDDRGGATKFGVTQATLSAWYRRPATLHDVATLTIPEAAAIYRQRYFLEPGIDKLPGLLRPLMLDMAVNHGPKRAVIMLQQTLNAEGFGPLDEDGKAGPKTCEAAARAVKDKRRMWLLFALVSRRRELYRNIVADDASQEVFLDGWLNRLIEFVPTAEQLRMA